MYEIKRIFFDRKLIAVFAAVLICNCFVFYRENVSEYNDLEYYQENYLENYGKEYERIIAIYREMDIEEGADIASSKVSSMMNDISEGKEVDSIEIEVYANVSSQLSYLASYSNKYNMILENAEKIYRNKGLVREGTFSKRNVDKTVEDFKITENINVRLDSERAMEKLIGYGFSDYLVIVFVVALVLIIYKERKRDLWNYVYTLKNGRRNVAAIRTVTILLGSIFMEICLFAENIIMCRRFFGSFGDMTRAAQSNMMFNNLTLNINMLESILLMFLFKVLAAAVMGGIFWLLISNIKVPVISFAIFGTFIVLQYMAYTEIESVSSMKNFKYINIFSFMDGENMLGVYNNLNIFGYAFGKIGFLTILFLVLYGVINGGIILMGERKPFSSRSGRLLGKINIFGTKLFTYTSVMLHELWKLIIGQRVWIMGVLFFIVFASLTKSENVYFDYKSTVYNQYMEYISGGITEEKIQYLDEEIDLWQKQIDETGRELEKYYNGEYEYNDSEILSLEKKMVKLNDGKSVAQELRAEGEELKQLSDNGYNAGYANKITYNMYIGNEGVNSSNLDGVLLMAFVVIITALIWSVDNQSNMTGIIRTSKWGRGRLLAVKTGISFFLAFLGETILFIMRYLQIDNTYGFSNMDLSAVSLKAYRSIEADISITGIIIAIYFLRLISLWLIICIVQYISCNSKNNVYSLAISGIVLILPGYLYYSGIDAMKYISPVKCVSVVSLWIGSRDEIIKFVIPMLVLFAAGCAAFGMLVKKNVKNILPVRKNIRILK
ncbi:MAG: hypothetical protein ACLRVQ_04295 [Lachnospiraceae bacterium]